ncbi:pancreatic triacylglycerol lipase-like [Musca autumnalis]|uniref:pancreatic triacylglycerol lipase-like n=1 Tax=Musca autumnalis TaxID=221902 RepID=UPI003CF00712
MLILRNILGLVLELLLTFSISSGFPCYFAKNECPNKDIGFWFYTKNSSETPQLLDSTNILQSGIQPQPFLEILIHGLSLNKDKSPNAELRPLLLEYVNADVISVDYEPLAALPCLYPWAIENSRVVAKCLAEVLKELVANGIYTPKNIHIIGFSLGAQIAGLAANYMDFRIGKITALDPAAWGFISNDPADKLDTSDADFVDVIHTDPFLFSFIQPVGHADFYPNLESVIQPGCSFTEERRNCNHFRSVIYYAESITTNIGFWSYYCGNFVHYMLNQCHHFDVENQLMGYYVSPKARGSYFLSTASSSPFAMGPPAQTELVVVNGVIQAITGSKINVDKIFE